MANSLTIVQQGNPIIPYVVSINLEINAQCSFTERVASPLQGSEFDSFFDGYVLQAEGVQKTHPDFSTQDETRTATWSVQEIGVNSEDPAKTDYDLTYSFAVNGVVTLAESCQSTQEGEELEAFFQQKIIQVESDWYSVRPNWTKQ